MTEFKTDTHLLQNTVIGSADSKKECLHNFHSVYYGSEWEVECKKCDKNIYDLYSKENANKIINNKILKINE